MAREFPTTTFERYVDDVVVHCHGERESHRVLAAIRERMNQVGLTLHPEKTKIVYCQEDGRREDYPHVEFTFLGYTFKERSTQSKDGKMFRSFLPAISKNALKRISAQVRSWRLHQRTHPSEADLEAHAKPSAMLKK